jgi:hypothetical protein
LCREGIRHTPLKKGGGQNARATGGPGILPAAILQPGSAVFITDQDVS